MKKITTLLLLLFYSIIYAQKIELLYSFDNYSTSEEYNKDFRKRYDYFYPLIDNPDAEGKCVQNNSDGSAFNFLSTCQKYMAVGDEKLNISIDFRRKDHDFPPLVSYNLIGVFLAHDNLETELAISLDRKDEISVIGLYKMTPSHKSYAYLDNNKWYRMSVEIERIKEAKLRISGTFYDLGEKGLDTPKRVSSFSREGYNYNYTLDKSYNLNFIAGDREGVDLLDNIKIKGVVKDNNCSVLSTEGTELANFNIYPTLVLDKLTIQVNKKINNIKLYDLLGKEYEYDSNYRKTVLDLSNLQKGVYILVIESNGQKTTKKIIKS